MRLLYVICLLLFAPIAHADVTTDAVVHYKCHAAEVTAQELLRDNPYALHEEHLSQLNLQLNVLYPRFADSQNLDKPNISMHNSVYKGGFLIFGEYNDFFERKGGGRQVLDVHSMFLISDRATKKMVERNQVPSSVLGGFSVAMRTPIRQMQEQLEAGEQVYLGGTIAEEAQLEANYFAEVVLQHFFNQMPHVEPAFQKPTSLMRVAVSQQFARLKNEPEEFYMYVAFIDSKTVTDFATQGMVRYNARMNCLKQENMELGDFSELMKHSKTNHFDYVNPPGSVSDPEETERDEPIIKHRGLLDNNFAKAGLVTGGLATAWSLKKWLNPVTAFVAALGVAPVVADDVCGTFDMENPQKHFMALPESAQKDLLNYCYDL